MQGAPGIDHERDRSDERVPAPEPSATSAKEPAAKRERPSRWRPWLRAAHRDLGYLAVGLTLVYALSGLAVNHISDWDPNFESYSTTHELGRLSGDDAAIARSVARTIGVEGTPRDVYRASPTQLEVTYDRRTLHIDTRTGRVIDEGQKPRWLLRAANWLHLNRGKKAWTYVADTYAVGLVLLAITGMFMLPGRKGLIGRGAILVLLGAAVPIVYVQASGGP
ncbi:MAG: PepSY-associated TM helix domain-containing protein [Deltaproteobacteria bacterium]|nr:PepSY-associated TM helix domain-containing protein [Deltaproteobacteria bacterium]